MRNLTFQPLIPLALWLPLAIAAAGLLVAYGFFSWQRLYRPIRGRTLALMGLSLTLPLLILLNPTWIEHLPPPAGKPQLLIVVDNTASMASELAEGESRYRQAVNVVQQTSRQLGAKFDVRIRTVQFPSKDIPFSQLTEQSPDAAATDLARSIELVLEDRPQGQAILLLSDGIHNTPGGSERVRNSTTKREPCRHPCLQ